MGVVKIESGWWIFIALMAYGFFMRREWLKSYWCDYFVPMIKAAWKHNEEDKNGRKKGIYSSGIKPGIKEKK